MARLSSEQKLELLNLFDSGNYTPADLARNFKVSPSTISRYLKKNNREVKTRLAHRVLINSKVKSKLRKVLSGYGVSNPDLLISELDKEYYIQFRDKEDNVIIYV